VLYSHAYGAGMSAASVMMEELASHGYVAVSVGHAFETSHFIRPDGTLLVFPPENEELRARGRERMKTMGLQQTLNRTTDPTELDSLIRGITAARPKSLQSLNTWVADIGFAIDRLEEMNAAGPFAGRMDLSRIGVIGHSFGGAASWQACLVEPRCRAGVNLDGLQLGDMLDRPVGRPFMFVHHDNEGAKNRLINLALFDRAQDTAYMVLVEGTRHLNFSDLSLPAFAEAVRMPEGSLGPIDGLRCLGVTNDLIRAFFDRHLRGKEAPLLDDPSADYPELDLRVSLPE
jgi:predicted dienelactone hydrolase